MSALRHEITGRVHFQTADTSKKIEKTPSLEDSRPSIGFFRFLMIHALPNYGRIMQGIIPAHAYALGQMGNLVPQKRSSISKGNPNRKPRQWKISLNPQ